MEKLKCRLKGQIINPKENYKPKGGTLRLSLLAHPLFLATVCICLLVSFHRLWSTRCCQAEYQMEQSPQSSRTQLLWFVPGPLWTTQGIHLLLVGRLVWLCSSFFSHGLATSSSHCATFCCSPGEGQAILGSISPILHLRCGYRQNW